MTRIIITMRLLLVLAVVRACASQAQAVMLFDDDFSTFSLGTTWQATSFDGATGAPDVALSSNGTLLEMQSGTDNADYRGIETIASISTNYILSFTLDGRVDVLNTGSDASPAAIELILAGSSGAWVKASASQNTTAGPDWSDDYADSAGNTAGSGSFAHSPVTQLRRFVLSVDGTGVGLTVYNEDDSLNAFSASFANLTLGDFGDSVDIVLRQLKVSGGNNARGRVDFVTLSATTMPEPGTLWCTALGAAVLLGRRRRRMATATLM